MKNIVTIFFLTLSSILFSQDLKTIEAIQQKNTDFFEYEAYDTIIKNNFFIKTVKGDSIVIYRCKSLEKIEIPNLKQAYFKLDGLEVLTTDGAQYYDNSISKIDDFSNSDDVYCGTVYSKQYRLNYSNKTKKYTVQISEGDFGNMLDKTVIEFKGLPENIESLSFLNGNVYISESINSVYMEYPMLIKIVKEGKSGIYSYNLEEAIYPNQATSPIKEETKVKQKPNYDTNIINGDTIFVPVAVLPIDIVPVEELFTKKGNITLTQVLPIVYNQIVQNPTDGLVYLYKDNKINIFPKYMRTNFEVFNQKTTSFYEITKNGKRGWLDIKTFKEYYFEK